MRDEVDGLSSTEVDVSRVGQAGVFDRLAGNLGALGFLIDMLYYQPALARKLFVFDAATGELSPIMGRSTAVPDAEPTAPESVAPPIPTDSRRRVPLGRRRRRRGRRRRGRRRRRTDRRSSRC